MLQVKNIVKYYGENKAVDNLYFEVKDGEIFGLLGENGAGKTTTFRIIMGLLDATDGTVLLNGRKIDYSLTDQIGFVTEERSLLTKMTVKEQLIFYGILKGMSEKKIENELKKWLKFFQIEDYENRKIKELSKGNQQKIQFMTAVIHKPELIVLDEPFSGLDPVNTETLKEVMKELIKENKYIIMSSHQMASVEEFCTDLTILNRGTTVLQGNLAKIKNGYPSEKIEIITVENIDNIIKQAGLEIIENTDNHYLVKIKQEKQGEELFKKLAETNIRVIKFEFKKPTLNEIFIEKVGA